MDPPDVSIVPDDYLSIADFFDHFVDEEDTWLQKTSRYHSPLNTLVASFIPPGQRVLEVGCGRGDLLASLRPEAGVGVDVSLKMVEAASCRHPDLHFVHGVGESLDVGETFDYVILWDLVPYVHDLQEVLEAVRRHCHSRSRVFVSTYSNGWRPMLSVAAQAGLRPRHPLRNWVTPRDLANLIELAGFEIVMERKELLVPTRSTTVARMFNGLFAHLPGLRAFDASHWLIARPTRMPEREYGVSVVVPCRNEAGSIADVVHRVPEMGRGTEIIFVENGSTDGTRVKIEQEIRATDRDVVLIVREAAGKWNAVQAGFDAARHEVLMILDADLAVSPEDLPKFYDALASGRGELINGNRLVYGMERGAMRFLNLAGNKTFATIMTLVLGQYVKDTLCGTKALFKDDWERIRGVRAQLGPDDPYGDYHLLLGAALLGLKILNIPVRYGARAYGSSNMQRFVYGRAMTRLVAAGCQRLWIDPVGLGAGAGDLWIRHESHEPSPPIGRS